ncbi:hypothetical protein BFP97_17850 [Roseivirga sp. 4D4]|nr:hypothetical protein BFP97_17850 [Roseivirga sp. 4D4]
MTSTENDQFDRLGRAVIIVRICAVGLPIITGLYFSVFLRDIGYGVREFLGYIGVKPFIPVNTPIAYSVNWVATIFIILILVTGFLIIIHSLLDDRLDHLRTKKIVDLGAKVPSFEVVRQLPQITYDLKSHFKVYQPLLKELVGEIKNEDDIQFIDEQYAVIFKKYLDTLKIVTRDFFRLHRVPIRLSLMLFIEEKEKIAIQNIINNAGKKENSLRIVYPKNSSDLRLGFMLLKKNLITETNDKLAQKAFEGDKTKETDIAIHVSQFKEDLTDPGGIYRVMNYGFVYEPDTNNLDDQFIDHKKEIKEYVNFFNDKYNKIRSFTSIRIDTVTDQGKVIPIGVINVESPQKGFIEDVAEYRSTYRAIITSLVALSSETVFDYREFILENLLKLKN